MTLSFFSSLFFEMGFEYECQDGIFVVALDPSRSFQVMLREPPAEGKSPYMQVLIKRDYPFRIHPEAFVDLVQMMAIVNAQMEAPCLTLLSEGELLGVSCRNTHWTTTAGLDKDLFKAVLGQFLLLSDVLEPFLKEAAENKFSMKDFVGALEKAPGIKK